MGQQGRRARMPGARTQACTSPAHGLQAPAAQPVHCSTLRPCDCSTQLPSTSRDPGLLRLHEGARRVAWFGVRFLGFTMPPKGQGHCGTPASAVSLLRHGSCGAVRRLASLEGGPSALHTSV